MIVSTGNLPARKLKARIFGALCFGAILIAFLLLMALLYKVGVDGYAKLSPAFFSNPPSSRASRAGIMVGLWGTIWVILLTIVIAVPIGIAAAIFLEEFTHRKTRFTEFIQITISNLAGVPSIVYGLLGLAVFVRWLAFDRSVLSGALTMALLILPMIIIVSQEALKAVPKSFREGSYALGGTHWQTISRQVLPSAFPGILTGIILAISRAMGETAPLITIGAVTFINYAPTKVSDQFTVLPIQIFNWTSRPEKEFAQVAAGGIIVLMGALLLTNALAIFLRSRTQRKAV
ncbi:MAG: phosphate ABC transporter permease PstA [Fimbriimonadaceae bacterium]|nr:phosphate ABC transporter permease PstA [Fimbriimonadaceae bacterium]